MFFAVRPTGRRLVAADHYPGNFAMWNGLPENMPRKKILVLTSTFPRWPGDATPPFVYELSRRLANSFETTVLAPHYPGSPVREERDGMAIRRFRYSWGRFETLAGEKAILPALRGNRLNYLLLPFFLLAEFFSTLYLVRRRRIDCIHAHWLLPQGLIAAMVKVLTGVPFVVTAHGGDVFGLQGRMATALKRVVLRRADGVTAVSRVMAEKIRELVPVANLEVMPMGVDATAFRPELADPAIRPALGITGAFLLFVGRLSEKKGVRYLLAAMPEVLKSFPDTRLVIIGTGELENDLRTQAGELGLDSEVIFIGAVPNHDLPGYYAAADVFVAPSITGSGGDAEGFGLTFVEAGLSGCLIVGTRSGGINDIIEPGVTGFMVPEKDSAALAELLTTILAAPERYAAIRTEARSRFRRNFDWEVIAARYRGVLEKICR